MKIKGVSWQWPGINGIGRQHLWFNSLQTGATASDQSAKWQVSTLIMLERPQATLKQWREKERTQKNSEELTSVNCRGQTPTFSPSLASIQCSSTRLMTVRMSPCKPELSNRDTESVRKDEKQINRWNKKTKTRMPGAWVCSPWRLSTQLWNSLSPEFILQHVTSTPFMSAGPVLSAVSSCSENHLTICIKTEKKSRALVCFNGANRSTVALI